MTYGKALVAIVISAASALVVALGTGNDMSIGDLGLADWLIAIGAVLGSGGMVWFTQNGPAHRYIKAVVAFLTSGIASLVIALSDNHISQAEWLIAFIAAATATGLVYQVSNNTPEPAP